MSPSLRLVLVLCALLLAPHVLADELAGRVVGVRDGDTIDVLVAARQVRVRLAGIDAPESGQAFARAAKAALSNLVHGKPVTVHWRKRDRYGRIVGKVVADGVDANLAMIELGLAWHEPRFADEQSAADRASYSRAASSARGSGIGLWRDRHPVPPWEFRQRKAMGG